MNNLHNLPFGLNNSIALLIKNADQLAIIQNTQLNQSEKSEKLSPVEISTILEYCHTACAQLDLLTETVGNLLVERQQLPETAQQVSQEQMVNFSGILVSLTGSLRQSLSTLATQSSAIHNLPC
ncbi:hypothetical protein [Snodgrassella alvi]|uniref:hypothetical protein n=1 Tax=Snodgrassella alvi TaxID=1196083 RepID=UPI00345F33F7